ncbi:MAG: transposase [Bacteroidota bacterium]
MEGRSSHKAAREFPALRRRYWGRRFWGRGYFSTTTVPSPKTSYLSTWNGISPILPA